MRVFETGATRDEEDSKPSYRGFLSPVVLQRFGKYMLEHQVQADGDLRDPDNWKKGIPREAYLDSLLRHVMDLWLHHEGHSRLAVEEIEEALCACLFNVQGYLHEQLTAPVMTTAVHINSKDELKPSDIHV